MSKNMKVNSSRYIYRCLISIYSLVPFTFLETILPGTAAGGATAVVVGADDEAGVVEI
jgi:hypothetical protein